MKVLITGGAGFIGSHVAELLQDQYSVVVLDDFSSGKKENLDGIDCELIEGSIADPEVVRSSIEGCSFVIHLAAMISVAESMTAVRECNHRNVNGLLNVLDASVDEGVKKIVFASSAAVYGNTATPVKSESDSPSPESPYAITKLDGEYYLSMYCREHGLQYAAPRFFNVYGPRQDPNSAYAAAVPIFVSKASKGEPIEVFGDGHQTRDFINVKDIATAVNHTLEDPLVNGVFNLGSGVSTSVNTLIGEVLKVTKSESRVIYSEERPGDIKKSLANIDRATRLGLVPQIDLAQGLRMMTQT